MTRRASSLEGTPEAVPSPALPRRPRLVKPLEIERTWSDAPATPTDTLDRFESAVAFAMREATRLHRDSKSRAVAVSRIEVPER